MKKITIILLVLMAGSLAAFSQGPQAHPKNLEQYNVPPASGVRADPAIFLQGNFVEIGIDPSGSCGVFGGVPAGYHPMMFDALGFVADHQKDGWAVGVPPQTGDYFLPGWPWEGWLAEFTYNGIEYTFKNCGALGLYGVPQTSLVNTSAGNTRSAVWTGTATAAGQSLQVVQKFFFDVNDALFNIEVTLKNTGSQPLQDVEFSRAVDPDHEQNITGNFTTSNYVHSQPTAGNSYLAEVRAFGLAYNLPMALRMYHPNAKAHVVPFDLEIYTPNEPLDFTNAPTQAVPYVNDVGVAVATRIPVMNPGQSTTFYVAYVLNEEDIINPPPPPGVPVSNWALYLMVGLIVIFTVIRFRRMS